MPGVAGNCLLNCAFLCTVTGRYADAATVWAAMHVHARHLTGLPSGARIDEQAQSTIRQALGPDRVRAAEERGAAMSLDTAAEYALMLTAPPPPAAAGDSGLGGSGDWSVSSAMVMRAFARSRRALPVTTSASGSAMRVIWGTAVSVLVTR